MLLGYNTNGFAHHRLEDALRLLADMGYQSVALTLDYHALNPFDSDFAHQRERVRGLLKTTGLHCVIETGARFLLDPKHKHQPTLLSREPGDRQVRLHFLRSAIDLAAELEANAVSFWSGAPEIPEHEEKLWTRLIDGCRQLSEYANSQSVRLAFEPEPGMFIDTMDRYAALYDKVNHSAFGLTIDVGHLHCLGESSLGAPLVKWKDRLWNIHVEDMKRGIHDHLMFGEGEIDFAPVFETVKTIDYQGGVHVELSRHSHDAVNTAVRALAFLRKYTDSKK